MASLYQRFTGKINTNNSFPHPPEASHLLGGQVADEENNTRMTPQPVADGRPNVPHRKKNASEDERVRPCSKQLNYWCRPMDLIIQTFI